VEEATNEFVASDIKDNEDLELMTDFRKYNIAERNS